jgi:hypothetical protein
MKQRSLSREAVTRFSYACIQRYSEVRIFNCIVLNTGDSLPTMRTILVIAVLLSCCAITATAQKSVPLSQEQLAEITARGRMLFEYDQAAWHATDAVLAAHPKGDNSSRFVCRKEERGWICVFGHLDADKFLIDYEVVQEGSPEESQARLHEPPAEDTGFYFTGVKAMMIAGKDFQITAEKRPDNPVVLPAPSGQFYVYMIPAQTKDGVFPLGGDARYLVAADGNSIIEKRQLHKAILERTAQVPGGGKLAAGFHNHVLSDVPEDTDVFYVWSRKPLVPEMIGMTKKQVYKVETNGTIKLLK